MLNGRMKGRYSGPALASHANDDPARSCRPGFWNTTYKLPISCVSCGGGAKRDSLGQIPVSFFADLSHESVASARCSHDLSLRAGGGTGPEEQSAAGAAG